MRVHERTKTRAQFGYAVEYFIDVLVIKTLHNAQVRKTRLCCFYSYISQYMSHD